MQLLVVHTVLLASIEEGPGCPPICPLLGEKKCLKCHTALILPYFSALLTYKRHKDIPNQKYQRKLQDQEKTAHL